MALRSFSDTARAGDSGQDLRNFDVLGRTANDHLGTVHDMLVDESGRTRYLCIAEPDSARHVLLPLGETDVDRANRTVRVADGAMLRSTPAWSHETSMIDEAYERNLAAWVDRGYGDERWYERPEYRGTSWRTGTTRLASGRLERLDGASDFRVAADDPDPRGWEVVGRDGPTLGEVDHLIGDTGSMRVLYLGVRVDRAVHEDGRIVLIPVGLVDLDTSRRQVIARSVDAACLKKLPAFRGGTISREDERTILTACNDTHAGALRYEHPRFRERELDAEASRRDDRPGTDGEDRPAVW